MPSSKVLVLLIGMTSTVCAHAGAGPDQGSSEPYPERFEVCFNHGCESRVNISLPPEQWQRIRAIFHAPVSSAREERRRIAQAIGALESLAGRATGIDGDKGGSLAGLWQRHQMDCIDESTNTRTYLVMLKNDGLLPHHEPADNARRLLPRLYQHYTAVIREIATGQEYAVDSWFLDNGQPPFIIPMKAWRRGWTPGDDIPEAPTPASSEASG